LLNNDK